MAAKLAGNQVTGECTCRPARRARCHRSNCAARKPQLLLHQGHSLTLTLAGRALGPHYAGQLRGSPQAEHLPPCPAGHPPDEQIPHAHDRAQLVPVAAMHSFCTDVLKQRLGPRSAEHALTGQSSSAEPQLCSSAGAHASHAVCALPGRPAGPLFGDRSGCGKGYGRQAA